MIEHIDDFFTKGCGRCARFATPDCSVQPWAPGLAALREICLSEGLTETVKWGHPCYTHAGRNVALFGALRDDFRLSFFNAALLEDPEGALERQGPNTRHPDMIRFRANGEVAGKAPLIRGLLAQAMDHAAKGLKPERDTSEPDLPEELAEALDADPALAEAFHRLTPGRRRSYVIALGTAKQAATRTRRVAAFRDRILAGKGATER